MLTLMQKNRKDVEDQNNNEGNDSVEVEEFRRADTLYWLQSGSEKCNQMTSVAFNRAVGKDEEYEQM